MGFSNSLISYTTVVAFAIILAFQPYALSQRTAERSSRANFQVLYTFKSIEEGAFPEGTLIQDASGTLYGIAAIGVHGNCGTDESDGCGLVFKLTKAGRKTDLHDFNGVDGSVPMAGVVRDDAGNFYGTTMFGGTGSCFDPTANGCGTVFKLNKSGKETVLHRFTGKSDGAFPAAGVTLDATGNLYGTTCGCGLVSDDLYGKVFKLDAAGHETVLHSFTSGEDGASPQAGLLRDAAGNLYGTTYYGGGDGCSDGQGVGCGIVFKIDTHGNETVLYRFTGGGDGGAPYAGLIQDATGNLYGTTYYGGDLNCNELALPGCGVVFKLRLNGNETVLHTFTGGTDGAFPVAGLVQDETGNLYGTTFIGGDPSCSSQGPPGCGVVFKLGPTGHETVLHSFTGGADGASPGFGSLLRDASGNLYGTNSAGVVFGLTP